MSLNNRGAGLVQRKRGGGMGDEPPPEKDDFEDEDNLADKYSKDAKLSLMEEVLLLGLKDEEVLSCSNQPYYQQPWCENRCLPFFYQHESTYKSQLMCFSYAPRSESAYMVYTCLPCVSCSSQAKPGLFFSPR